MHKYNDNWDGVNRRRVVSEAMNPADKQFIDKMIAHLNDIRQKMGRPSNMSKQTMNANLSAMTDLAFVMGELRKYRDR